MKIKVFTYLDADRYGHVSVQVSPNLEGIKRNVDKFIEANLFTNEIELRMLEGKATMVNSIYEYVTFPEPECKRPHFEYSAPSA